MKRSTQRILTTHTGSLIRPPALVEFVRARQNSQAVDDAAYALCLKDSVARVVRPKVPIIRLTGEQDRDIDLKATELGAMDYLIKGQIDATTIERSIRYSIARKRTEEQLREVQEKLEECVEQRTAQLMQANTQLQISEELLRFLSED